MPHEPNPDQRAAIESDEPAIVLSSGAGAGKTTVLVDRYLRLLDSGVAVGQIVAITFTERAARQLRARVRSAIELRLLESPNDPVLNRHRDDLETAAIDTFHGFCGSLLREYAEQASLDPTFLQMDEPLAAAIRERSVREELYRLLLDESETSLDLQELIVLYGWPTVLTAVDSFVQDADPLAWQAFLARAPEGVIAEWLRIREELWPRWIEFLQNSEPWLKRFATLLDGPQPSGAKSRQKLSEVRLVWTDVRNASDFDQIGRLVKLLTDTAKVAGISKAEKDDPLYEVMRDTFEAVREKFPKRLAAFLEGPGDLHPTVLVARRFLKVALRAEAAYRDAKSLRNALDFQDLIVGARNLLADDGVCRELRERIKVLLLDELQDTDPVQMELVNRLRGSNPHDVRLFAVGDEKQSIYRFRGAEVNLFRTLRNEVEAAGRLELRVNYRSVPGILSFVNALFANGLSNYEPSHAFRSEGSHAAVEFLWSEPEANERKMEDARIHEADSIARRLLELFRAGREPREVAILFRAMTNVAIYETALRQHGIDYYLIGGRAFFAQQEIYDLHNLLQAVENPFNAPALAGALRSPFFNLSDDGLVILATHEEGLWAGLNDPSRFARLPDADQPVAARAREGFRAWRRLKDQLPIVGLLHRVFAETGFDAATQFEPLADRKLANLWKLVDLARAFDESGLGLAAFAERLGNQVAELPREEQAATKPAEANVVRLMSIHQAKGLEFPIAILADLSGAKRPPSHDAIRWDRTFGALPRLPTDLGEDEEPPFSEFPHILGKMVDELDDWQEALRLFYVACTRAEDLLILSAGFEEPLEIGDDGFAKVPSKSPDSLRLLADRFDLITGVCRAGEGARCEPVRVVKPAKSQADDVPAGTESKAR